VRSDYSSISESLSDCSTAIVANPAGIISLTLFGLGKVKLTLGAEILSLF
jgi:hypothetical protein